MNYIQITHWLLAPWENPRVYCANCGKLITTLDVMHIRWDPPFAMGHSNVCSNNCANEKIIYYAAMTKIYDHR